MALGTQAEELAALASFYAFFFHAPVNLSS